MAFRNVLKNRTYLSGCEFSLLMLRKISNEFMNTTAMSRAHLHRKAKNITDETVNEAIPTTSDAPVIINKELSNDETKKKKLRAKVNLEMMKQELKQLEDPPGTSLERMLSINRLKYDFFDVPCEDLAQNLLGKILVRKLENGTILKGKIVETESYLAGIDKASQTYQYRLTPRTLPLYLPSGTIYVYMTYGMYCCVNISCQGEGAGVLIRALEPVEGIDQMIAFRLSNSKSKNAQKNTKELKLHEICNGPSKLCMALQIAREHCKYSIVTWKGMWIETDTNSTNENIQIVKCPRIGIESAGPEWANKPLRYYIYGNSSVSKRNKKAEAAFTIFE